jgi:SET domain-containing protein
MRDKGISEPESDCEHFTRETMPFMDKTVLVCGNIQDIQSVFIDERAQDTKELSAEDKKRMNGDLIDSRHKIHISLYLKNTVFSKLLTNGVM